MPRKTMVVCLETGRWVHPDFRKKGDKAKCGNCGNTVPTIDDMGVIRYVKHRHYINDLREMDMVEMRTKQPERFQ